MINKEPEFRIIEVIGSHFEIEKKHIYLGFISIWNTIKSKPLLNSKFVRKFCTYQDACDYCNDALISWSLSPESGKEIRRVMPYPLGHITETGY